MESLPRGWCKVSGIYPFRGSPGKGGAAALKGIISAFRNGPGGGFVVDGSQGPAQVAQKGLLLLAMYSGCPIFAGQHRRRQVLAISKLGQDASSEAFCQGGFSWGPMIRVERGASSAEIEEYRVQLERTLNEITGQAEKAAGAFA